MVTAEDILKLKGFNIVSVDRDTTVYKTVEVMVENKIGAVIIKEKDEIVGLWTERDLMRNIVNEGFDLNETKVGDCLLSKVQTAAHTTSLFELQAKFIGRYTRHLFITIKEEVVGLISIGDVMKTHLNVQKEEMDKLKSYVSMEYYEEWNWDAKKR